MFQYSFKDKDPYINIIAALCAPKFGTNHLKLKSKNLKLMIEVKYLY